MISWLTGIAAMRPTRRSVRSSRSAGSGASTARPQSAACAPLMQSPVKRRRFARWSPSRCAHNPAAGTPHTPIGGEPLLGAPPADPPSSGQGVAGPPAPPETGGFSTLGLLHKNTRGEAPAERGLLLLV